MRAALPGAALAPVLLHVLCLTAMEGHQPAPVLTWYKALSLALPIPVQ